MLREPLLLPNPVTSQMRYQAFPRIHRSAFVAPTATLVGDVTVDQGAFIGFGDVIRADWGPVYIGPFCNLHDQVSIHEKPVTAEEPVGVYLEEAVSVLHGSRVHGPCRVGANSFIGQMVNLFDAQVGRGCVIMHGALLTGGVRIRDGRYVAPGQVVDTQAAADALPPVPEQHRELNQWTVRSYAELGRSYQGLLRPLG